MPNAIGPTFAAELAAAGLAALPIAWAEDGTVTTGDITSEQSAALASVLAAHDPSAVDTASLLSDLRADRDARLSAAVALLDRHRNQADFGLPTTITTAQAGEVAVYAQALRDLPATTADPANPEWPPAPEVLQ